MFTLPLIVDPVFYAVAVPAVLLLGVSKSGFGAGFGSLAVPLMALAIPVPQAAAILMPLLFVMDVMGLAAFRHDFDRKLLRFMLPFALLGIVLSSERRTSVPTTACCSPPGASAASWCRATSRVLWTRLGQRATWRVGIRRFTLL